jgi:hypothetical protein
MNWWAIIPAGALTVFAIIILLSIADYIGDERQGESVNAIIPAGLATTFAVVWLRHEKAWARIVNFVLAMLAVGSIYLSAYSQIFGPMIIILVGLYLFYTALRPKVP